jgi:hypothetical protein
MRSSSRRSKKAVVAGQAGPAEQRGDRLSGVPPLAHDDDERPSREDMNYGQTIFTRPPVPLPRWMRGRRQKPH